MSDKQGAEPGADRAPPVLSKGDVRIYVPLCTEGPGESSAWAAEGRAEGLPQPLCLNPVNGCPCKTLFLKAMGPALREHPGSPGASPQEPASPHLPACLPWPSACASALLWVGPSWWGASSPQSPFLSQLVLCFLATRLTLVWWHRLHGGVWVFPSSYHWYPQTASQGLIPVRLSQTCPP